MYLTEEERSKRCVQLFAGISNKMLVDMPAPVVVLLGLFTHMSRDIHLLADITGKLLQTPDLNESIKDGLTAFAEILSNYVEIVEEKKNLH